MRWFIISIAVALATALLPAAASADSSICHNGVLSDDAGQGCADGLYAQVYGSGSSSGYSDGAICHDGILSDDRGQNCADGLYAQVYGSGGSSTSTTSSSVSSSSVSSGGYGTPPESIAQCESGGDPTINTGNGFSGKWQFTDATWTAVTGLPGPASNYSEATQDAAAAKLYAGGAGAGNWPVCSHR